MQAKVIESTSDLVAYARNTMRRIETSGAINTKTRLKTCGHKYFALRSFLATVAKITTAMTTTLAGSDHLTEIARVVQETPGLKFKTRNATTGVKPATVGFLLFFHICGRYCRGWPSKQPLYRVSFVVSHLLNCPNK